MKILWLSWKDSAHPLAGGAETVSTQIRERLVSNGHTVSLMTSSYPNALPKETVNGVEIIRLGNRYSVYLKVRSYYKAFLTDWPDLIIDEMNTLPFASSFYSSQKNILLTYQLAREVWFYQIAFPFSLIGFLVESLYLRLLAAKGRYELALTESTSTKVDLIKHGFSDEFVRVFRVGMALQPLSSLPQKKDRTTILSLGTLRPMKRTLHAIKAFETARDIIPTLQLVVAGDATGWYGAKITRYVHASRHRDAIIVKGRVPLEVRVSLMKEASLILVTSIKEGWGLTVTEANSQGTPAIAYDTDGLRDSLKDKETGMLVTSGDYRQMGKTIVEILDDTKRYDSLRENAWEWSKEFTFENSYGDFVNAMSALD